MIGSQGQSDYCRYNQLLFWKSQPIPNHWHIHLCTGRSVHFCIWLLLFFLINLVFFKQTQEHFQPRVHGFEVGMKLEVVHPIKPSIICPATVTKSLGPYYFAITTDYQEDVPSVTFCCHSDSPGIFPAGWCSRHQVELAVPASKWKEYHQLPWRNMLIKYVQKCQKCTDLFWLKFMLLKMHLFECQCI